MLEEAQKMIEELQNTIDREECFIVVLGEFNHGKSTFVNSLMGKDILPSDILPTTATINVVGQGENKAEVHYEDGRIKAIEPEELNQYVGNQDVQSIDFIALNDVDFPIEPPYYVVDTPGLNDANLNRSKVAYHFIPNADLIFFILKASQPISGTEMTFLKETLLKEGLKQIIFILNFADEFEDEEEELEEIIEDLREKLESIDGIVDPVILPYDALRILQYGGEEREGVQAAIERYRSQGTTALRRGRQQVIIKQIKASLEHEEAQFIIFQDGKQEEKEHLLKLFEYLEKDTVRLNKDVQLYYEARKTELLLMIQKSIQYAIDDWTKEAEYMIRRYQGPVTHFAEVFESDVSRMLDRERKKWIEQYIPQIDYFLESVKQETVRSLRELTQQQKLEVQEHLPLSFQHKKDIVFRLPFETHDPTIKAGIFAGGAAAVMLGIGGSILMPFIGLAAYPLIRKRLEENALNEVKTIVAGELRIVLDELQDDLFTSIQQYASTQLYDHQLMLTNHLQDHYTIQKKNLKKTLHLSGEEKDLMSKEFRTAKNRLLQQLEAMTILLNGRQSIEHI